LINVALESWLGERQHIVLIRADREHTDHVLTRDGCHEALTRPDGVQVLWVSGDGELDFAVGDELLSKIQFELNEQKVGSYNNYGVLLFVKEDRFNTAGNFAHLRAILQVVSEAHGATCTAEEKQTVRVVCGVGHGRVDDQRAKHDLIDCSVSGVLAHWGHALVGSPDGTNTLDVTGDHAGAVSAESDVCNGGLMDSLVVARKSFILVPEGEVAVLPADSERLHKWVPLEGADGHFVAHDFEVRHNYAFLSNKDDAGRRGGDCQHHIKLVVGPGGEEGLLAIHHHVAIEEH